MRAEIKRGGGTNRERTLHSLSSQELAAPAADSFLSGVRLVVKQASRYHVTDQANAIIIDAVFSRAC